MRERFWGCVALIYELKLEGLRKGFAQSIAYGIIGFAQCGSRVVLYQYKERFTTILVVDESLVVIETTDHRRWSTMESVSSITGFMSSMLPHDLSDESAPPLLPFQGDRSISGQSATGRDELLSIFSSVIGIASTVGIDDKASLDDLIRITQPAFDRLLARIAPPGTTANSSSSTSAGKSRKWAIPDVDLPLPDTEQPVPADLKELASICAFARPEQLLKTFRRLFPDATIDEGDGGLGLTKGPDEGRPRRDGAGGNGESSTGMSRGGSSSGVTSGTQDEGEGGNGSGGSGAAGGGGPSDSALEEQTDDTEESSTREYPSTWADVTAEIQIVKRTSVLLVVRFASA